MQTKLDPNSTHYDIHLGFCCQYTFIICYVMYFLDSAESISLPFCPFLKERKSIQANEEVTQVL